MTASAARPAIAVPVMALAIGVFAARPLIVGAWPLVVLFVVLGTVGLAWPLPRAARERRAMDGPERTIVSARSALAVGIAAFALGRLVGGLGAAHAVFPSRVPYISAITLAALSEELFFRRFVYAVLRPGGAALAVGGSAALFAVAHVTVYGWWVLPLDLAAGVLLSWQRWATGSWVVPAATHVVANLLVVL